jgi:hypothetical protein
LIFRGSQKRRSGPQAPAQARGLRKIGEPEAEELGLRPQVLDLGGNVGAEQ